jgi:beta-glucosidase
LEGIRKKVGGEAEVLYAEECKIAKNDKRNSFANWKSNDSALAPLKENQPLIEEARRTAAKADLVVLVLGDVESTCRESWAPNHLGDRLSLDLPGSQMEFAKAVLAAGKPDVLSHKRVCVRPVRAVDGSSALLGFSNNGCVRKNIFKQNQTCSRNH